MFSKCSMCGRGMIKVDPLSGQQTPTRSKYPVCMGCLLRHHKDPKLNKLLAKKLHVNKTTDHHSNFNFRRKPTA